MKSEKKYAIAITTDSYWFNKTLILEDYWYCGFDMRYREVETTIIKIKALLFTRKQAEKIISSRGFNFWLKSRNSVRTEQGKLKVVIVDISKYELPTT